MSAPRKRFRDRWIASVLAHHREILVLAGVLTVVAGLLASKLNIESDLRALLPADHPVIQSLEGIESSFVRLGSVNVLIEGGEAAHRRAFADAIAGPLEALEEVSDVEYRLRSDYFAEHALYYLSDQEMGELDELVQAWTHYEACSREPDMCLDEPDAEAPGKLRKFVRAKQDRALGQVGFADYYEREGIDALVVLAHPTRDSSDLEFSRAVTQGAREVVGDALARADAPWAGKELRVAVVGPYAVKADENASIRRDMLTSGTFGLAGVVLVLFVLFRSMRAVFTLLVPLLCGVAWSMAGAWLLLGHLNTMTSLISTVVMGMGIDAGIHFLHRARREREEHGDREAIILAFGGLIVPLLVASATTLGAFVVMATNSFPAFREFGLIAILGVALCLLAMVTVFPSLLLLVGIKLPPERRDDGVRARLSRALVRYPGAVLSLVIGLSGAAYFGARAVAFENNGRMLQSASRRDQVERDTQLISKIFGKDIHAGILVIDTLVRTREVLSKARELHAPKVADKSTVVADFFAIPDLLPDPAIDVEQRKEAIAVLTEDIPEHTWENLEARAAESKGAAGAEKGPADEGDAKPGGGEGADPEAGAKKADEDDAQGDADDAKEGEDAEKDAGADAKKGDDAKKDADAKKADAAKDADAAGDAEADDADEADAKTGDAKGGDADEADAADEAGDADDDAARIAKKGDAKAEPDESLTAEDARRLQRMLKAEPVRLDDLPPTILAKVRSTDGRYAVYAYPNFDAADILKGVEFMEETAAYSGPPENGTFVGETTVYAAMYLMMRDEAPSILGAAAAVIVLLVLVQLRSIVLVIITLLPLVISVWWLLGLMGAEDIRFTLFNIPILPAVLGIGVDNGVYLTDRLRRIPSDDTAAMAVAVRETGGAIFAATSTTAIGFASFIIADSGGLQGIGKVAVVGILCAAAAALLTIPGAFALGGRLRRRR
ncbi:MAG: MMPL family transporter [Nannocystaceae bacterium]